MIEVYTTMDLTVSLSKSTQRVLRSQELMSSVRLELARYSAESQEHPHQIGQTTAARVV